MTTNRKIYKVEKHVINIHSYQCKGGQKMTEQLTKFAYGGFAGSILNSKESNQYVTGALDALAEKLNLGEDSKGFIEGAYASKEGVQKAASVYSNIYQEKISESKGSDLVNWYTGSLQGLEDSEKSKIEGILTAHGNETLKEISAKIQNASYVLRAPEGMFDETKINEANETLGKYQNFLEIQNKLETFKMEDFRPEAVIKSRQRSLKDLASRL